MGLLILIAMGAALGWLASIVLRRESPRGVMQNVAVGVVASVLAGSLSSSVSVLSGISAPAILVAFVGAGIAIAAFNLFRNGTLAGSVHD